MDAGDMIANEIGKLLLIVAVGVAGAIALGIYLWHHVHFTW